MFTDFRLNDQWFAAMDAGTFHGFTFSPGVSMMVLCSHGAEVERLRAGLSADPAADRDGWCVDRWGVSWQVGLDDLAERPAR